MYRVEYAIKGVYVSNKKIENLFPLIKFSFPRHLTWLRICLNLFIVFVLKWLKIGFDIASLLVDENKSSHELLASLNLLVHQQFQSGTGRSVSLLIYMAQRTLTRHSVVKIIHRQSHWAKTHYSIGTLFIILYLSNFGKINLGKKAGNKTNFILHNFPKRKFEWL